MTDKTSGTPASSKATTYLYSLALILIWGTAYTLVGYAVDHISPAWIVASRTFIAAIVLTIYIHMRGYKLPPLRDKVWLWYGVLGLIGMTAPFYLMARAQIHVDSGLTSILVGFMPLATIVLAHFFIEGEPLSWRKGIGFLIGFAGIVLLFIPETLAFELVADWRAQSLILVGATLYAITVIVAKRAPPVPASVGAAMMVISAAIWAMIWVCFVGLPDTLPPRSSMLAVLGIAIGSTAFAQILYLKLIHISGPTLIAKLNYLVPICALAAGIVFLEEKFTLQTLAAMSIIFAGLLIARSGDKAP